MTYNGIGRVAGRGHELRLVEARGVWGWLAGDDGLARVVGQGRGVDEVCQLWVGGAVRGRLL